MGVTPGDILRDGLKSVQRNQRLVLVFALACAGLDLAVRLVELPLLPNGLDEAPPWAINVDLLIQVAYAAIYSALVAIVFARLGKDIDRPLWKCRDDRDALQRFFMLWLIINLFFLVLLRFQRIAMNNELVDVALTLEFLKMTTYIIAYPAGVCIMYSGALDWSRLGESLKPIARKFDLAFAVLVVNFSGYIALTVGIFVGEETLSELGQLFLAPVLVFLISLLDCLVFAATWRVCMVHRDEPEEDNDDDLF